MNKEQFQKMHSGKGFVAALDQSGGSTPKALAKYGIGEDAYKDSQEMFKLVHQMRVRIIKAPAFNSENILAAILFEVTMNSQIDGLYSGDYLWQKKGIIPLLKVDKGLLEKENGVQLMKNIDNLPSLLDKAVDRHIFGTKMRSLILEANETGIYEVVKQQFEIAKKIIAKGLVPILEPEVDINANEKEKCEKILHDALKVQIEKLSKDEFIMLKLTLPSKADLYLDLTKYDSVIRVLALSGGYAQNEANKLLAKNHNMIASFSRALSEGLSVNQSDADFNQTIQNSIQNIYAASINK